MSFLRRDKSKAASRASLGHSAGQCEPTIEEKSQSSEALDLPNLSSMSPSIENQDNVDHKNNNDYEHEGGYFRFNSKYRENPNDIVSDIPHPNQLHKGKDLSKFSADNYSPRSSVSIPGTNFEQELNESNNSGKIGSFKENYKGFHGNRHKGSNVPPLSQPIKPRFPKKNGSLLGKLIYSSRKDSQSSEASSISDHGRKGSSGIHIPSMTPLHNRKSTATTASNTSEGSTGHRHGSRAFSFGHDHHSFSHRSLDSSILPKVEYFPRNKSEDGSVNPNSFFLDMDLNEMKGIVKPASERKSEGAIAYESGQQSGEKHNSLPNSYSNNSSATLHQIEQKNQWKAPDSWDVKIEKVSDNSENASLEESDSNLDEVVMDESTAKSPEKDAVVDKENKDGSEAVIRSTYRDGYPILFGVSHTSRSHNTTDKKGQNYLFRVFKEDNTFTTILCTPETTTTELLSTVRKKFFLDSVENYQLSIYMGNSVKILEPYENPLKIQMGLLILSGYTERDNFKMLGREDLSFICKFVVNNVYLRNLTHKEEAILSKDYVNVDISGLNLNNIPIIFHQHTYEIERLNVSRNPSIYIPLDFIHSCNNLKSIIFANNGCSKFPINFLEAKRLTELDMQKNFINELPSKFSHLSNLTDLNLSTNQLSHLPKSFGKLQNLEFLNLSSNYFNVYPEAISDLVNLVELDLSYNDLAGLPESIGKLVKLTKLNLCTNKLQNKLPDSFTALTALKRFDMRYNKMSNVDILGNLPNLEVLFASKNEISKFSDRMSSLRLLYLDRNPITNLEFNDKLKYLTVLDLSRAKIAAISSEFIDKIENVEKFILDKNHLVALPEEIGKLSKLTFLSLHNNNLQTLPSSIGILRSLQYLDLHSNNLKTLPDTIWKLRSLTVLNVSSNILSSFPKPPLMVAKSISSSVNLANNLMFPELNTKNNSSEDFKSEGEGETELSNGSNSSLNLAKANRCVESLSSSLLVLNIGDNRLSEDCFESFSFLVELKTLNLSYNEILEIPEGALLRLSKLTELFLSGNELTTLPSDDLGNLKSLKYLFLNSNKLTSLPAELSSLTNLQNFDVGSNQLKYNISNWPYDWNWHLNKKLKYVNFSGNRRFEIKQSHAKNPETGEAFDNFYVLKNLKVLGLVDVTITSSLVPDQSKDLRIRTTSSELENIGFGVADWMGSREVVSNRDIFIQKFRGNEDELLICSVDGRNGIGTHGHRISLITKSIIVTIFSDELNKMKPDESVQDAIRKTFLALNKEINGTLSAMKNNCFTPNQRIPELNELDVFEDGSSGSAVTLIYLKNKTLYTGNVGDIEGLLLKSSGNFIELTRKHDPTKRGEFERIRASGGFMSENGNLDGELSLSRGVGFFNYLPHMHSGPDISEINLTTADDMIVIATKVLWDYISYELAVDILRQEKSDPLLAAQKLRDYAISYGATDKISVIVVTMGHQKKKTGFNSYMGRDLDSFASKKRRDRPQLNDSNLRRLEEEIDPPIGELAVVFTDIKSSTLLWDTYPVPMRSAIKIHNYIMRRQLRIVGGYEVKTEGDAFMVSFPTPTSALLWCFNVQQQLLTADWPAEILQTDQCCEVTDADGNIIFRGLSVRMGIHWGSPVCEPDIVTGRMDYFGPMVNRAARINAIADGGQIAISSDFYAEMKTLYAIHKKIASGESTLIECYQGNTVVGEIIEKEISTIEETKVTFIDFGEKRLKGLEIPENVTLAYPKNLEIRYDVFLKSLEHSQLPSYTKVIGAVPTSSIYQLRDVSLRLENICSALDGGTQIVKNEHFQKNSSRQIVTNLNEVFKEYDMIGLLNHVVTRIENCATNLELRQRLNVSKGLGASIDFGITQPLNDVMKEFMAIMNHYDELKKQLPAAPKQ